MQGFGLLDFLLTALATWRVTKLLVDEDGPYNVVGRIRRLLARTGIGRALDCFYCTSLWVAAPAALVLTGARQRWALAWLALSGAACLLERATERRERAVLDLEDAERLSGVAR